MANKPLFKKTIDWKHAELSNDELLAEPVKKQPFRTMRIEVDKNSLYGFIDDPSLFAFIALGIYFGIDRWAGGQQAFQIFQMAMIGVAIPIIILIIIIRKLAHLEFVFKNIRMVRLKLIIAAVNIAVAIILTLVLIFTGKSDWNTAKSYGVVAVWEQLIFAIVIPYLLVLGIVYLFRWENFRILAAVPACIISGILFGVVHTYAYSADWGILWYIMIIGSGLHLFGYFLPSTSILIHYIIDMTAGI